MSVTRVVNTTVAFFLILFCFKIYTQEELISFDRFLAKSLIVRTYITTWFLAVSRIELLYKISGHFETAKDGVYSNSNFKRESRSNHNTSLPELG